MGLDTYSWQLGLLVGSQLLGDLVDLFGDALRSGASVAHVVLDTKIIVGSYWRKMEIAMDC